MHISEVTNRVNTMRSVGKYLSNMNKFCDWFSETKVISDN